MLAKRTTDAAFGRLDAVKKSNPPSHDDWMAAISDLGLSEVTSDPNAKTTAQLATLWGVSRAQASTRARQLVDLGAARRILTMQYYEGGACRLPAYILIKKPSKR